MWRFYLINIGAADKDTVLDWSDFEKYEKDKSMEMVYRGWLAWVADTQPKAMQVQSRKLIGVKGERAAMCSAESVKEHFESLDKLLLDIGVLTQIGGLVQNPRRVWCVDEKGMTDEAGKLKFSKGLSVPALGPPTCSAGQSSFKHVSVLPFICLDGSVGQPYIVARCEVMRVPSSVLLVIFTEVHVHHVANS